MSPSEERPVMAAEVMAAADDGQYDTCDLAEAMVEALLACSSSGGPVVIGTDGTVRELGRKPTEGTGARDEADQVTIAEANGWVRSVSGRLAAGDPNQPVSNDEEYGARLAALLLAIIDRLAPPAQDAENQEDKP